MTKMEGNWYWFTIPSQFFKKERQYKLWFKSTGFSITPIFPYVTAGSSQGKMVLFWKHRLWIYDQ
jgi:hypothetical protein